MSVAIEAFCVVIRKDAIERLYPGGVTQYGKDCPNSTYCHDSHLTSIGFMSQDDGVRFAQMVMAHGIQEDHIALVDQNRGLISPRSWAECLKHEDGWALCWLAGTDRNPLCAPAGWTFEKARDRQRSMSFMPAADAQKRLEFVRKENNVDVYRDRDTGELQYVGRPDAVRSESEKRSVWKRLFGL